MFTWNLMLRTRFGSRKEKAKARQPKQTVRLVLEVLEDRTVPSTFLNSQGIVSEASPPPAPYVAAATSYLAAKMDQLDHMLEIFKQDVSIRIQALDQEIAQVVFYAQQQWDHLLGINLNASNPLPAAPVQHANGGSNSSSTLQPDANHPQAFSTVATNSSKIAQDFGRTPLAYVPNVGQTDSTVNFLAQGPDLGLYLTPTGAVFETPTTSTTPASSGHPSGPVFDAVAMQLTGANPNPQYVALDKLPGVSNYFLGNDPNQWHTNVPNYGAVEYDNVYSGINLVYDSANINQLEYHFVVNPGASPNAIQQTWQGVTAVSTDSQGNLILQAPGSSIVQQAPQAYQLDAAGNKQYVAVSQVVTGANQVSFRLGNYDPTHPLIIDPTIGYSTYLGGSGDDVGLGIAVDRSGDAYVTGATTSDGPPTPFPTYNSIPNLPKSSGYSNVFVTKFNSTGNALVYSSYFGGLDLNQGSGIAVDSSGNAYITGYGSNNYPMKNPYQSNIPLGSGIACFVTKINAAGDALVYSTFLGENNDQGNAIAIDSNGDAYVTGLTPQTPNQAGQHFPIVNGFQSGYGGGDSDAFITELAPAGNSLVYSSLLGGPGDEHGTGVAVDSRGNAYITGYITPSNTGGGPAGFPTTKGAFQTTAPNGTQVGFVVKVNSTGSTKLYSTYLGGNTSDQPNAIAVDGSGHAFVTGWTQSSNFPTLGGFQSTLGGTQNAFVTELAFNGASLVYSSYLGGNGTDSGNGIALDSSGDAFVVGATSSSNFPTVNPFQSANAGYEDAFVTEVDAAGSALTYSSYLGGGADDMGNSIALDSSGNAYLTGQTKSINFPTVNPFQGTENYEWDAFVTKVEPS